MLEQVAQQAPTIPSSSIATIGMKTVRLSYIDNIRIVLTALVIAHHLSITYGGAGSWYYQAGQKDLITTIVLTLFTATNQAFFMGFFFLIAAFFTPGTYDRKGGGGFLRDRFIRLGIPLLVYEIVNNPLVIFFAGNVHEPYFIFWGNYLTHLQSIGDGPVWFLLALLIFTCFYALWRQFVPKPATSIAPRIAPPTDRMLLIAIGGLAITSFVVRIWQPIDSNFFLLNFQPPFFAQYIVLFIVGVIAARNDWFSRIPASQGMRWLRVALCAIPIFPVVAILGGAIDHAELFKGGLHWQSFFYATWEATVCVGMCMGLLVLFRDRLNRQSMLVKAMAGDAYTAYIIHPAIIVPLAVALQGVIIYPLLKFVLLAPIAIVLTFGLSHLIRMIPGTQRIL